MKKCENCKNNEVNEERDVCEECINKVLNKGKISKKK